MSWINEDAPGGDLRSANIDDADHHERTAEMLPLWLAVRQSSRS